MDYLSRSPSPLQSSEKEKESSAELTERCFQELLGHAAYGNINNAVKPVLMYMDNHSLWEGKVSAAWCFKIIMYSIQSQHSLLVIQQLLGHLDVNSKNAATVRAGIVEVLSEAAVIVASGSVGSFANTLPTYQRSEVMLFIMGKIPLPEGHPALGSAKSGVGHQGFTHSGSRGPKEDALTHKDSALLWKPSSPEASGP
ncbi:Protein EFR3-like B [Acipenser ruthenus]|uniref:Protein EFR3-like B n=1 Tax=Acipenser ruthenus TaxID=7906 RepID=A0A662YRU0_ACIRT|nr:Protein EFR3-like B [Acipenser ruthenus]